MATEMVMFVIREGKKIPVGNAVEHDEIGFMTAEFTEPLYVERDGVDVPIETHSFYADITRE